MQTETLLFFLMVSSQSSSDLYQGMLGADLGKKLLLQRGVKRDDSVDEQVGLKRQLDISLACR